MKKEAIIQKLEKLDPAIKEKIMKAKSPEKAYEAAMEGELYEGSFDEFAQKMQDAHDEFIHITEEELAEITKGVYLEDAPEGPVGTLSTAFVALLAAV